MRNTYLCQRPRNEAVFRGLIASTSQASSMSRELSHGDPNSGNALVQGENFAVLKTLLPRFESAVRCCYIDPPYNNQERHYHYYDSRDHRTWLDETTVRVELVAEFLRDDGSLWISIDDREVHYLKVACDAILGRRTS